MRRTYANLGASSPADIFSVSLLMLHSGQTLATETGAASITVGYFNTPDAQDKMRRAAETVAAYLDELLAMDEAELAKVKDPNLPPELEAILRAEEEEAGEANEPADPGDEDSADYEKP